MAEATQQSKSQKTSYMNEQHIKTLKNPKSPIQQRMSALFSLRTNGSIEASKILFQVFNEQTKQCQNKSDLLLHEICYCLGQMLHSPQQQQITQSFLMNLITKQGEKIHSNIVIHQAAEALGNISLKNSQQILKSLNQLHFTDDHYQIVKETCQLALAQENWRKQTENGKLQGLDVKNCLFYTTNDPAPPYPLPSLKQGGLVPNQKYNCKTLQEIAINANQLLFQRYRALFTLRQINSKQSTQALCSIFDQQNFQKCSPLLKHQVAFILGQMMKFSEVSIPVLEKAIANQKEAAITRHQSALALGEFATNTQKFTKHQNKLVSQSCITALSFLDFWKK